MTPWKEWVSPEEIDARLKWPPGRTSRILRRRKLPHYVLPDGAIRLVWSEIEAIIKRIVPDPATPEGNP